MLQWHIDTTSTNHFAALYLQTFSDNLIFLAESLKPLASPLATSASVVHFPYEIMKTKTVSRSNSS